MSRIQKPEWLKIKLASGAQYGVVSDVVKKHRLNTICSSGKCPNIGECWSMGTATFMILGDICTRSCKFCATLTGKPLPVNEEEPSGIAESVRLMQLKHCVLTSVDRDDLPDGGASHWSKVIREVRAVNPETVIEVLIPDFDGDIASMNTLMAAKPDIIGHNLETVARLTPLVRSRASYQGSLEVLRFYAKAGMITKSGLMLGLGETLEEILDTMRDLREAGCHFLTLGQYLQPGLKNLPVSSYIHPDVFASLGIQGRAMGFSHVESGPLVRSSYRAEKSFREVQSEYHA